MFSIPLKHLVYFVTFYFYLILQKQNMLGALYYILFLFNPTQAKYQAQQIWVRTKGI